MSDWDTTPEEYVAYIEEWKEEYGIDFDNPVIHDEMTQEQHDKLVELDKQGLVWTEHTTCEDSMYSHGFAIFGDCSLLEQESSGCGCYQSYAYYIGTVEGTEEYITTTTYAPCSVCNPDGEGEGVEGCEGPEQVEGAVRSDCEGGFINWYFD